ncbi:O-antigen ligase family protein [Candidatus Daviesbacteria bacterium]|nr:O-antigen ligase family protein [Candidatus Daviesbacteria bacterium]
MKQALLTWVSKLMTVLMVLVIFITPLIFVPLTTEFFDIPKLIFLSVTVLLLLLLWSLKWVLEGKVVVTKTPLDLPLVLLLAVLVLSTVFTDSKPVAIFGNLPRVHGSIVSFITYILFYFILVSNIKSRTQVKALYYSLLSSAVLVAAVSIVSYFNWYIPLPFAQTVNFTPTGSSFSASTLLVLMLPVTLLSIANPNNFIPLYLAIILSGLFAAAIALIGDMATGTAALAVLGLTFFTAKLERIKRSVIYAAIPFCIAALILILGFIKTGQPANPFFQKRLDFPKEIQLPLAISWQISASAFRDAPFLGTGPGTYLFNFTKNKPIEFNMTKFWNLRFDSAFNEYLQILGTLGITGFLAFLYLSFTVFKLGARGLMQPENNLAAASLSISAIAALILLAMHVSTPTTMVVTLTIWAMLVAMHKMAGKAEEWHLGIKASRLDPQAMQNLIAGDVLPITLLIVVFIFVAAAASNIYRVALADYQHRLALDSIYKKGPDTYYRLQQAKQLNSQIDLYRINLAQVDFALANGIAAAKGPSEASPTGSLTDQDKQDISQLLSQSISEARNAIFLSPRNSTNYEILGSIYRQITGVAQNALSFALDSYGQAILRDPLNPLLRFSVGEIHRSIKNYDLAIRFFTDAINLKPDLTIAYYRLAATQKDKGDFAGAELTVKALISLLNPKDKDYDTASKLLSDIKSEGNKTATGSAKQNIPQEEKGALQKKQLPKVLNLPQPENIATPEAVKVSPKPSPKNTPSPSPTP